MNSRNGLSFTSGKVLILICIFYKISEISCKVTAEDDAKELILSKAEKNALDKLKFQVLDILPEDFMKTDFYLIRWVRNANLDVAKAKNALMETIKWRQENRISNIIYEDFSDMQQDYRLSTFGGHDKEGHPFGTLDLGEWDLRAAVMHGKRPRLQRYLTYTLEVGMQELFRVQRESSRPITRGLVLIDGTGGNARQHLCPQCLAILFFWTQTMERHYPSFFWEIIMINAPPITAIGLQAIKPAMSEETIRMLKIFDTNKSVWMKYLDDRIERSERTARYGGTKMEL